MPWCPKCRMEYLPRVHRCPDCGSWLANIVPEEEAPAPAGSPTYGEGEGFEQVLLCTVVGDMHASLIGSALRAAGIPSRQQTQAGLVLGTPYGVPSPISATYGIYVNRRDLKQAAQVYRDHEGSGR
jgi:hypothetical protein